MTFRFRSAVTGLFVTAWYALRHPKTTIRESVKRSDKKPGR